MNEILVNEPGPPGKEKNTRDNVEWGCKFQFVAGTGIYVQSVLLPNWHHAIVCVSERSVADRTRNTSFLSCKVLTRNSAYAEVITSDASQVS